MDASGPCSAAVERKLAYRSEWKVSRYDRFSRVAWYDEPRSIIYYGDQLEAQNGFGAWKKIVYSCSWNLTGGFVINAEAIE